MEEKHTDKKYLNIALERMKNKNKDIKSATETTKLQVLGCQINDKTIQAATTEQDHKQDNTQTTLQNTKQLDTTNGELDNFTTQTTTNTITIPTTPNPYETQLDLNEQINSNEDQFNSKDTTENKQPANEKKGNKIIKTSQEITPIKTNETTSKNTKQRKKNQKTRKKNMINKKIKTNNIRRTITK